MKLTPEEMVKIIEARITRRGAHVEWLEEEIESLIKAKDWNTVAGLAISLKETESSIKLLRAILKEIQDENAKRT
jgi:hypothetical protein